MRKYVIAKLFFVWGDGGEVEGNRTQESERGKDEETHGNVFRTEQMDIHTCERDIKENLKEKNRWDREFCIYPNWLGLW